MVIIKYTKAQYNAKITTLEGYHAQLATHLSRMEALREKMFSFWDDENARTVGKILNLEIKNVRNSMDTTQELLTFYKSAVEKLEGSNIQISDILGDIFGMLS